MKKKITVKTGSLEEAAKEFIDVWHQVEKGEVSTAPIEKISFTNQRLLFKTLTPRRFEILEHVHEQGGMSIRFLAKALGRDYSNVHSDVKLLSQLGLMIKDENNAKYYVHWDVIVTEISLPIIKNTKVNRRTNSSKSRTAHG